jgi:transcriptional regulator with XRE-family HTH domain
MLKGQIMTSVKDMKSLGEAVRRRRRELGYTQSFLAEYAGVSASFLSELENGKETIQAGKAMEIIALLGMDVYISKRGE